MKFYARVANSETIQQSESDRLDDDDPETSDSPAPPNK